MNKSEIWIIDPNNKTKVAVLGVVNELPSLKPIDSSPAALKDAYNGLAKEVGTLEMQLEMTPDKNFWIGWDLSRQALIEQFQKNNRSLLLGTYIGGLA